MRWGRHRLAAVHHEVSEHAAVLGHADAVGGGAEHAHAALLKYPVALQINAEVQGGLASHCGDQSVGPLFADYLGQDGTVSGSI